jgi:hypothetical protein
MGFNSAFKGLRAIYSSNISVNMSFTPFDAQLEEKLNRTYISVLLKTCPVLSLSAIYSSSNDDARLALNQYTKIIMHITTLIKTRR